MYITKDGDADRQQILYWSDRRSKMCFYNFLLNLFSEHPVTFELLSLKPNA